MAVGAFRARKSLWSPETKLLPLSLQGWAAQVGVQGPGISTAVFVSHSSGLGYLPLTIGSGDYFYTQRLDGAATDWAL